MYPLTIFLNLQTFLIYSNTNPLSVISIAYIFFVAGLFTFPTLSLVVLKFVVVVFVIVVCVCLHLIQLNLVLIVLFVLV